MCSDYIGCSGIGTGPTGVRWPYARAPALIPFTARDLAPNTARWYEVRVLWVEEGWKEREGG